MFKYLTISVSLLSLGHASCLKAKNKTLQSPQYKLRAIEKPEIEMLLWNIQKGSDENWPLDMENLGHGKDLILIQEAHMTNKVINTIKHNGHGWKLGKTFDYKGKATGVLTLSNTCPQKSKLLLSTPKEPITNTPKASLMTLYDISSSNHKLMVINTHGINFVGNSSYAQQIDELNDLMKKHEGPLIWAGDLNTWSKKRLQKVLDVAQKNNLMMTPFPQGARTTAPLPWSTPPLDYIFYRELKLESAEVRVDIQSSDHKPLIATFSLLPNSF